MSLTRAVYALQLKLSFYHQRDLQIRTNDDRHWDFVVAPAGPQRAAAGGAASAADQNATAGGAGGQTKADDSQQDPSSTAAGDNPQSPQKQRDPNAPVTGGPRSIAC